MTQQNSVSRNRRFIASVLVLASPARRVRRGRSLVPACLALLMIVALGVQPVWADTTQGETPTAAAVQSQGGYSDLAESGLHREAVEALAADGVFDGTACAPGRFCHDAPLTRRTMAVWLVRVLDGGDPDDSSSTRFGDVGPGQPWSAHIERLAELSVTRGCSTWPARFCPEHAVTRAQAAAFLVRGFNLPPGQDAGFEDVASGSDFRPDIDSLASAGITRGCAIAPARYCPDRAVTKRPAAPEDATMRSPPTLREWPRIPYIAGRLGRFRPPGRCRCPTIPSHV